MINMLKSRYMNRLLKSLTTPLFLSLILLSLSAKSAIAAPLVYPTAEESGLFSSVIGCINKQIVPVDLPVGADSPDHFVNSALSSVQNQVRFNCGGFAKDESGNVYSPGILGIESKAIAMLYQNQPSGREYLADILDNIGIPTVTKSYAQGTGYTAMSPFLPIWKAFRNFAYSLYIIMFVVVGIMIMLRTKVNAQTVITIQSALPNLLITLILITFSYAIVGFMIDLMYFLIYFVVYLISSTGIISGPTQAIDRLLSYSAWSVVFEGRNSIISAAALALGEVISGIGSGALEVAGTILSMVSPMYLIVAVAFAIAMLKLMFNLLKSYVMLIVQTITAPIQILFNAMPGSKAFGEWLKKTASYLIPFPVAAAMFILAAVFVGDPTNSTLLGDIFGTGSANPFGINSSHEFYQNYQDGKLWMPPFTLTGSVDFTQDDVMAIIGFFIFLMTPATVKMAQEWLQVKESPYASEAAQGFFGIAQTGAGYPMGWIKQGRSMHEQKKIQEYGAKRYAEKADELRQKQQATQDTNKPI